MAKEWTVTLNTGAKMPAFGLGTWQSKPGEVAAAVEVALKEGYRHIDGAFAYMNEGEIGEMLQKCFKEGVVKREDIFITSKLWSEHHAPEDVLPCVQKSLQDLQVDYLDLYLVHSPLMLKKGAGKKFPNFDEDDKIGYDPDSMAKTWEAMEELLSKGLVKAIGISNFSITKTERLLQTAKIVPAVNQVECHPYFQQQKLKDYCDSKGIIFECYAPIGSPGRPGRQADEPIVLEDPVVKEIAEKHNATPAQVCISFLLHRGMVVIPKSVNPKRIAENFKATQVLLDADEVKRLRAIDKDTRLFRGEFFLKKGLTWQEAWDVDADAKYELK